ncbi:helix-turn-helix domain-containing protein [Nocardia tengchongensis]
MPDNTTDDHAALRHGMAARLRAARKAAGMSMQKLADECGVASREVIYNLENPEARKILRPVNVGVLIRLSEALGVTPIDLVPELASAETAELAAARQKLACIAEIVQGAAANASEEDR